jgi:hypothetical protein
VRTYADLLHNIGFARVEDLRILTRAWRTLFALARPGFVLCDHSPTALLAPGLDEIPCATIGTGFCCLPVGERLTELRPWLRNKHPQPGPLPSREREDAEGGVEERVLANVNEIRAAHGKAPWERLGQLYSSAADSFLTTFEELDHFARERAMSLVRVPTSGGARPAEVGTPKGTYRGVWESEQGEAFVWPSDKGPRVFFYTHRFPARD